MLPTTNTNQPSSSTILPYLISQLSSVKDELASLSVDVRENIETTHQDISGCLQLLAKKVRQYGQERDEAVLRYRQEEARRRSLLDMVHELKGNIRVLCRIRPKLSSDVDKGQDEIVISRIGREIVKLDNKEFVFDHVFGPTTTQEEVYEEIEPNIMSVLEGIHACIFAYGQTSSGKTYTMSGTRSDRGINYRAIETLFTLRDAGIQTQSIEQCKISVANVEVYNERIRDLLRSSSSSGGSGNNWLEIRQDLEHGIHLPDCTWKEVFSPQDVWDIMEFGQANRAQAHTNMNCESSRSHSVVMVEVNVWRNENGGGDGETTKGRLILVDLAGSERLSKSGATGERQKEAQNINKSLSALGDVIAALGNKKTEHVPFRNSKLTFLLQDSMMNNNKVMMIVQVAPTLYNAQESLCTLGFGSRARKVEMGQAKIHNTNTKLVTAGLPVMGGRSNNNNNTNETVLQNRINDLERILGDLKLQLGNTEIRAKIAEAECVRLKQHQQQQPSNNKFHFSGNTTTTTTTTTKPPILVPTIKQANNTTTSLPPIFQEEEVEYISEKDDDGNTPLPAPPPQIIRRQSFGNNDYDENQSSIRKMNRNSLTPPSPLRSSSLLSSTISSTTTTLYGNNSTRPTLMMMPNHGTTTNLQTPSTRKPMREITGNINIFGNDNTNNNFNILNNQNNGNGSKFIRKQQQQQQLNTIPASTTKKTVIAFGSRIDSNGRMPFGVSLGGASRVVFSNR
jgi:hypothetical protein